LRQFLSKFDHTFVTSSPAYPVTTQQQQQQQQPSTKNSALDKSPVTHNYSLKTEAFKYDAENDLPSVRTQH
jgi:hypothetical protein